MWTFLIILKFVKSVKIPMIIYCCNAMLLTMYFVSFGSFSFIQHHTMLLTVLCQASVLSNTIFIYLFIYLFNYSCMFKMYQTKVQYLVYNCHHKLSVIRVHESEKELITVQCIITIIKANYNFKFQHRNEHTKVLQHKLKAWSVATPLNCK